LLPTCLQCITFTNSTITRLFGFFRGIRYAFCQAFQLNFAANISHKFTHHAILWTFREVCCALCQAFQLSFAANMSSMHQLLTNSPIMRNFELFVEFVVHFFIKLFPNLPLADGLALS
jgi:hypothetical protein